MGFWDDVKTYTENAASGVAQSVTGTGKGFIGGATTVIGATAAGVGEFTDPAVVLANRVALGAIDGIQGDDQWIMTQEQMDAQRELGDSFDSPTGGLTGAGTDAMTYGSAMVVSGAGNYANTADSFYGVDPVDKGDWIIKEMDDRMASKENLLTAATEVFLPTPAKLLTVYKIGKNIETAHSLLELAGKDPYGFKTKDDFDAAVKNELVNQIGEIQREPGKFTGSTAQWADGKSMNSAQQDLMGRLSSWESKINSGWKIGGRTDRPSIDREKFQNEKSFVVDILRNMDFRDPTPAETQYIDQTFATNYKRYLK